jgi:hypothetical protein
VLVDKDILYISRNASNKKHSANDVVFRSSTPESSSVAEKFYTWSAVDVKLYEHFSAKLWQQVAELEDVDTFWDEVMELKAILPQVAQLCAVNSTSSEVITLQAFDKTQFTVARNECYLFTPEVFVKLQNVMKLVLTYYKALCDICFIQFKMIRFYTIY